MTEVAVRVEAPFDLAPGLFYTLHPSKVHVLTWNKVYKGADIELVQYPLNNCLFKASAVRVNGASMGMAFRSPFMTTNCGSYLLTSLTNAPYPKEGKLLLRTEHLSVYSYPNKAALVVSHSMSKTIASIMESQ